MSQQEIIEVVNRLLNISADSTQIGSLVHELVERDTHGANRLCNAIGFELEDKHRRENAN
jgi:hypothetical protein